MRWCSIIPKREKDPLKKASDTSVPLDPNMEKPQFLD